MPKILFVLSSVGSFKGEGGKDQPSGWYLPEAAHPFYVLAPHAEIIFASPKGGEAPLDPSSVEYFANDPPSVKFLKEEKERWEKTEVLSSFLGKVDDLDAIFYVGGHAPMFDLATDEDSIRLIREFAEKDKVISAVCHGPAALVNVKLSDGSYLIAGQPVNGISDKEEESFNTAQHMPFSLEKVLRERSGGNYSCNPELHGEKVVVARGGKLITGQNPASGAGVARSILQALRL